MQLRIPFLPSERRKPCSMGELFDEDMIFVQGVSSDVVTLQVMKMHVSSSWNRVFRGANRDTTLVHLFASLDIAGGDFVPDGNILREHDLAAVDHVPVPGSHGRNHDEHIVIAMNA